MITFLHGKLVDALPTQVVVDVHGMGYEALIPLSSLAGLFMPALRATMSDLVAADGQGELQGALSSLRALGLIAAPFVYSQLFAAFTGEGAPIFLPGVVFAVPVILNLGALVSQIDQRRFKLLHATFFLLNHILWRARDEIAISQFIAIELVIGDGLVVFGAQVVFDQDTFHRA